jgi:hypothetical protein
VCRDTERYEDQIVTQGQACTFNMNSTGAIICRVGALC